MNWKRGIGYGILIWVIMFAVMSAFVAYRIDTTGGWAMIVGVIITAMLAYTFTGMVNPNSKATAFYYGLVWAVVGVILDYLITAKYPGAGSIFSQTSYWLSYVLLIIVPVIKVQGKR